MCSLTGVEGFSPTRACGVQLSYSWKKHILACGQMSLYGLLPDTPIILILSPGEKQITEATTWVRDRRVLLSRIILAESSNRLECL